MLQEFIFFLNQKFTTAYAKNKEKKENDMDKKNEAVPDSSATAYNNNLLELTGTDNIPLYGIQINP